MLNSYHILIPIPIRTIALAAVDRGSIAVVRYSLEFVDAQGFEGPFEETDVRNPIGNDWKRLHVAVKMEDKYHKIKCEIKLVSKLF